LSPTSNKVDPDIRFSITALDGKLLLAISSYFAEIERELIPSSKPVPLANPASN
jgi:hypothetical protein